MLVATLPLPPSTNHLYANAGARRILTKEGKLYKEDVMKRLMQMGARRKCPEPPFVFRLWVMVPDKQRRDVTNMVKAIEDAVAAYLCYDDSANHVVYLYKALDRTNPRAVIQLVHKDRSVPAPPDTYRPQGDTGACNNGVLPSTLLIDELEFDKPA